LGQCEVSGIELTRFPAEKDIEGAATALVGLKERDVRKHLGGFVALGQNDLSVAPQPELLGGLHQVRLVAHSERRAQNPPKGRADQTIHRQRFFARHRPFLRQLDCASRSHLERGAGVLCFICFAERLRNPSMLYSLNRRTYRSAPSETFET
jgi:hypothetical protein